MPGRRSSLKPPASSPRSSADVARSSLGPGLDGILVVAKPAGPTSHDVVALVRRLAATKRVGHGGTLDPFASGVLPVFLGHGTRVVEYHLGDRKAYRATVCFGASSETDDLEGELTPATGPAPTRAEVEAALPGLTGAISQRPPAYSAIKVGGRRAYAMARAGETVELASRDVTIHSLELVSWDDSDADRPIAVLDVECSAGTYVRALARDLGTSLGSAAYLGALTRTASGPFTIDDATPLDEIRAAASEDPDGLKPFLRPLDTGLDAFPVVRLTMDELAAIARGQFIRPTGGLPGPADHYRLTGTRRRARGDRLGRSGTARPGQGLRVAGQRRTRRLTMHVVQGIDELRPQLGPIFVVIGVFDGLHLGHTYLLEHLVSEAAARGAQPTVITFDHHPDEVLMGKAPPLLLDPGERLERLEAAGVVVTVVQPFDEGVRQTPYDAFVERIRARVALSGFLMTPDAAFGFERAGTPAALAELGQRDGFDVVVVPTFGLDGQEVRSSTIRDAVVAGDLTTAARLLGRPVTLTGSIGGAVDGRTRLDFRLPVALPPDGDYAAQVDGRPLSSASSAVTPISSGRSRTAASP